MTTQVENIWLNDGTQDGQILFRLSSILLSNLLASNYSSVNSP